jgi:hypothetical protein
MRGLVIGVMLGAAALAGCSKPADNSAGGAASAPSNATNTAAASSVVAPTVAAAPAPSGPPGPITLAELPAPKAGTWLRASVQDGKPQPGGRKCLDGKPIDPLDGMQMTCAKEQATRTASGGFVVIADCGAHGVSVKLTLAGEGDFSKSFETDATMDMKGDPGTGGDLHTKNHSVWTYAAPACAK